MMRRCRAAAGDVVTDFTLWQPDTPTGHSQEARQQLPDEITLPAA